MKRLITVTILTVVTTLAFWQAQAAPLYHPPGSNLTYGAVSNGQSIMSDITNPAAGAAVLQQNGNQYRFGILSSIGVGYEFGEVDNLYSRIDTESQAFQNLQIVLDTINATAAVAEIEARLISLNALLVDIEANGYAKVFVSGHLPVMPVVIAHKALGGSLVLDINGSVAARATALNDPVNFNSAEILDGGPVFDDTTDDVILFVDGFGVPTGFTIDNDATVLVKAARVTEVALGYSRPFMKARGATLYGGLRGRYYKVDTTRTAIRFSGLIDGTEQAFDDALDSNLDSDTGLGLDVGVLWVSEHYRAGATLTNVNEPEFKFSPIDLSAYNDPAGPVYQKLSASNTYTMEKQLQLEAALYTANQNWVISGGFDANAVEDVFGDEYRWATVSAAYATDTWWLPGIRAGLRKNLAGSKINYYTLGMTVAVVNVDLAWSSDKVTIDGSSVPRGAMLNVGLEVSF